MRPTIKSIAALTGYSVGTVSNALRNDPSVKTDTREEIQDLARKQGYEANLEGVKLRTGKTLRLRNRMGRDRIFPYFRWHR